jgi:signal transduction histidine kinase
VKYLIRALQGFGRAWRYWLPAGLLALLGIVVTQELDLWLLRRVAWVPAEVVSGILNAIMVLIPVTLYVLWRRNAVRYRQAYERLQAAEALRDDLAAMLVHDLKNPIITAGMAVNLMSRAEGGRELTEARREELTALAEDSLRRAERMVGDILQVAQAEAGEMPLRLETANIAELARRAAVGTRLWFEEGSVELSETYPPAPVLAQVDTQLTQRVVENLLMNAAKYTPPGGRVEVCVTGGDGQVRVSVRDSGCGIPPQMQERIFDKFQQAEARRDRSRHDVGLGLAFARLAVQAHGGKISVDSRPDEGTTFAFVLPVHEEDDGS